MRSREDRLFDRYRQRGDTRSLAELFDRTAPEIWRVAGYLTRDRHLAEDAVQATFLAALEHAARWDRGQRVVPWLLGILANQVRSLRRQRDPSLVAERLASRPVVDPAAEAEGAERAEHVRVALARMPEKLRAVLERYLMHGEAPAEIAERLGLRPGATRMRLQRGLAHLRRLLPAGFASGCLVASEIPAASLAAMRRVLLAHAAQAPRAVAVGGAFGALVLTGGIAMKKIMLGVLFASALAWAGIAWWPQTDGGAGPMQPPASSAAVLAAERTADTREGELSPGAGDPAARELVATLQGTGSLRVRVLDRATKARVERVVVIWHGSSERSGRIFDGGECVLEGEAGAGTFEVKGLRGTSFGVDAPETRYEIHAGVETLVELQVDTRAIAEVNVVDEQDRPVAGATVCASRSAAGSVAWYEMLANADASGRCRVESTHERTLFAVVAGRALSQQLQLVPGRSLSPLTLRVGPPAGTVRGRVIDVDGSPVPDAVVAIVANADAAAYPPMPLCARTDARGEFTVGSVAFGACSVFAVCEALDGRRWRMQRAGRAEGIVVTDAPLEVEVRLARGAGVHGLVETPARDRARQVEVSAILLDREGMPQLIYERLSKETIVDAHGAYRLTGLLPGRYVLYASDRLQEARHEVVLADGEMATWSTRLGGVAPIALRIVDAAGRPIGQCALYSSGRDMASGRTDVDGRFRFETRSDAAVTIAVFLGGHPAAWFDDIRPQPDEQELRLAGANLPGTAHGRVIAQDGPLPVGLRLQLVPIDTPNRRYPVGDAIAADGSFRLEVVPPDTYRVAITASGRTGQEELASAPPRTIAPGATCDLGTIVVPAHGRLFVQWPRATVRGRLGVRIGDIFDDAPTLLRVGRHEILCWDEASAPLRTTVVIAANEVFTLPVALTSATPCTFLFPEPIVRCADTLTLRGGRPEPFTIRLPRADVQALRRGLPPGRYTVLVTGRDGQAWPARDFAVADAPLEVSLSPR